MTNKLKFSNYFLSTLLQINAPTLLSLITIQRRLGDGESCEGELEGGGVAPDQLRVDVEEDAVVVPVRVVERARRHVEEVLRGQPEGVHRRGHQVCADLLERNAGTLEAFASRPLAVHVPQPPVDKHASRTVLAVMAHGSDQQIGGILASRLQRDKAVRMSILWFFLLAAGGCKPSYRQQGQ